MGTKETKEAQLPAGICLADETKQVLSPSCIQFLGGTNKFTCRYDVMIENDKHFQIAKKIIGSKGFNMKNIIEQCQAENP